MKDRKFFILVSLLGGCVIFCLFTLFILKANLNTDVIEERSTPSLIRLHILANSNSVEDQALKYMVRDAVIKTMQKEFAESKNIDESRTILLNQLVQLEAKAEKYIAEGGYTYQVKADYGIFEFPVRDYGQFILPAGKYEALRLIIGEGKGANWWCVLFPPLCFVEGEESLCLENDFEEILAQSKEQGQTVKIKPALKIAELWQTAFGKG